LRTLKRLALVTAGAAVFAFNIKTFVHAGELVPGGFPGLTLLVQELGMRYLGIHIPFSVFYYLLNAVPAVVCFRFVGKKFTMYSVLAVFATGLMIDFMPAMFTEKIQLHDPLLAAVFGGILNALGMILCLKADASGGGTDFIAIYISERYRRDAWNYILVGNCVILVVAGALFTFERALYSIIFQFATTQVLKSLYRAYQQKTMLIITNKPAEIFAIIRETTRHGATNFTGTGLYKMEERNLLYSVVYSNEVTPLIRAIRATDPAAFINVVKTEHVNGNFYIKPKD